MKMGQGLRVSWVVWVLLSLTACGGKAASSPGSDGSGSGGGLEPAPAPKKPLPEPQPRQPQPNPMDLVYNDIAEMSLLDPSGAQRVDSKYNGVFSAIFGGTTGAAVTTYFNERVRHLVDPAKVAFIPQQFANESWLKAKTTKAEGPAPGYKLGAVNIGTLFWLEGLVNQVSVSLLEPQATTTIDSSRVGIVMLGEGYTAFETEEDGSKIDIPAQYRQSILLHEARHSDCTGGITEAQLKTLRGLHDASETERTFSSMPCGHLHRVCKSGDLVGVAACDIEPWGAYTVGAIYALTSYANATTAVEQEIFKAQFVDQISRVQVKADDLLAGRLGKPDMSSQGLRR